MKPQIRLRQEHSNLFTSFILKLLAETFPEDFMTSIVSRKTCHSHRVSALPSSLCVWEGAQMQLLVSFTPGCFTLLMWFYDLLYCMAVRCVVANHLKCVCAHRYCWRGHKAILSCHSFNINSIYVALISNMHLMYGQVPVSSVKCKCV